MIELTFAKKRHVIWVGNSKEVLRNFPSGARKRFGRDIFRLELGLEPAHYRPMRSLGPAVFELKEADERAWYRVVYCVRVRDSIFILHAFEKRTGKTSKRDLRTAALRLRQVSKEWRQKK